jgi:hypothetical protein
VISWGTILYGAVLSALLTGAILALWPRTRRVDIVIPAVLAALPGPIVWNAILHATHAEEFFTDAPIAVIPASWQDTGSGVFTFAMAALVLGVVHRRDPAGEIIVLACVIGLIAFLVDVYLY